MDPLTFLLLGGGIILAGAIVCRRKPEDKFWRKAGIKNANGEYPYLISKRKKGARTTYVIEIPSGVDGKKLLEGGKWNHMLLQAFGDMKHTEYKMLDGHRLAIDVFGELPEMVEFVPSQRGKALEIPIGQSHKGAVYLKLGDMASGCGIAGQPGGGKSTMTRVIIAWLVLHKVELRLIDLKGGIEQKTFADCGCVKSFDRDIAGATYTIHSLVETMNQRYEALYEAGKTHYTDLKMKPIVLVMDEFADLEDSQKALDDLIELGRKGRAAGVFTLPCTQRPDSAVMQGKYKATIPAWLCFKTRDATNSMIILGHGGAEKLPGRGRCIAMLPEYGEIEMQGAYLSPNDCDTLMQPHRVEKKQPTIAVGELP